MPSRGPAFARVVFLGLFALGDLLAREQVGTPADQHSVRAVLTAQVTIPIPDPGRPVLCTTDRCDPAGGCRHDPLPDNTQLGLEDEGCTRRACFGGQVRYGRNDSRDTPCQRWYAGRCAQRTCEAVLPPARGAVPPSQGTRFLCVRPTAAVLQARCEDGVYCNGVERCDPDFDWRVPGFTPRMPGCGPGVPVRCDDGLKCTKDSCDEAGRRCLNEPIAPGACDVF